MLFFIIMLSTVAIVNIAFYYSTKKTASYQDGRLLLVNIPAYAYNLSKVKEIEHNFKQETTKILFLSFLTYLPMIILPDFVDILYFLIIIWINIYLFNLPFKKYRNQLLKIKKDYNWPSQSTKTVKVDLAMLAHMEKQPFNYKRYLIVLIVDIICLAGMIYFKANITSYLYLVLQFIVLIIGIILIKRLPNKTYCDDTKINITINSLRIDYVSHCFFSLILIDALFNFAIQFYLLNKLPFIIVAIVIILMMINMILIINHTKDYQRKKQEILASENQKEYTIDDDSCWKIGFLGPYYYNKADPKTFVYCGTQMVFNTAKTSYKYFVISIWVFIIGLLIIVFGYPFYLEYTNQLVDVAIENNVIVVDSPLYDAKINLDNINKVELTDDLGDGIRTNGSDAIVYTTGYCTYDKYGDCKVYKANFHDCYIILYTDDLTYIINDDDIKNTKQIYQEIKGVINNDY